MRYVQHPVSGKLIPAAEVDWGRGGSPEGYILPDIEPFVSPVDGSVVGSRTALREHNRRNDVVNVREFDGAFKDITKTREREEKNDRLSDIVRVYNEAEEKGRR